MLQERKGGEDEVTPQLGPQVWPWKAKPPASVNCQESHLLLCSRACWTPHAEPPSPAHMRARARVGDAPA